MSMIGTYANNPQARAAAAQERADRLAAKRAHVADRLAQLAKNAEPERYDDVHNPYDFDDTERY